MFSFRFGNDGKRFLDAVTTLPQRKKKSNYVFIVTISAVLMEGRGGRGVQLYNRCFQVTSGLTTNTSRVGRVTPVLRYLHRLCAVCHRSDALLQTVHSSEVSDWSCLVKSEGREEAFIFFFLPTSLTRTRCQFEELALILWNTGSRLLFLPLP